LRSHRDLGDKVKNPLNCLYRRLDLDSVLDKYRGLVARPSQSGELCLAGQLGFTANLPSIGTVQDLFSVEICVPEVFPKILPRVRELAGRIPKKFHKLHDGSLCLGSPLRLRVNLQSAPTLKQFIELCVVPYLVGFSVFERTGYRVQLNVRVTLSAGKGAFGVIPEWVRGRADLPS